MAQNWISLMYKPHSTLSKAFSASSERGTTGSGLSTFLHSTSPLKLSAEDRPLTKSTKSGCIIVGSLFESILASILQSTFPNNMGL